MLNLLWHEIRSRRGAMIGWAIGLTLFALMYTLIYPEMQDQMASLADLSIYQAMGIEVATFEGYLGSTVIGFVPILLGVYAILTSTATLAGEEDDGTLELLLTTRLPRWKIVTAKALALLIVTLIIVAIAGLGNMFGLSMIIDQIETSVTGGAVFAVVLSSVPLVWAFMMIGLFLGSLLPTRRLAMMVGLIIFILSYFGENIGNMVEVMEGVKPLSLFTYFDSSSTAFADGVAAGDVAVLLTVSLVAFALAVFSFQRRDVTVGNWPWQRVRID
ncbi:MAG: ABC transporter permease subunit [Candidatus Promineifilaceae bacterium]